MSQQNKVIRQKAALNRRTIAGEKRELLRQFQLQRPIYEAFNRRAQVLLDDLLNEALIPFLKIEGRTKDPSSLEEKICRRGKSYGNALSEIPDLSGVRVIAYDLVGADQIADMVKREFKVDWSQYSDRRNQPDDDSSGYSAVHFVVELDAQRASLLEWKRFRGLRTEIQVRTLLEHHSAKLSHEIVYKPTCNTPQPILDRVKRLSRNLTSADQEHLSIIEAHHNHRRRIASEAPLSQRRPRDCR